MEMKKEEQNLLPNKIPKLCNYKGCELAARGFYDAFGAELNVCDSHKEYYKAHNWAYKPFTESEVFFGDELCPAVIRPPEFFTERCKHHQMLVDKELRTVECGQCGTKLDPIQCLIELAHGYRSDDYKVDQLADYKRQQKERDERERERRFKKKLRESNIKPLPTPLTRSIEG